MRREGLVSTIVPVHNRPRLLCEAVASVLAQTYRLIEIIIVDDGSSDETPRVARDLAAAQPDLVRVIHTPNAGPGAAREAGRQLARGEFIQYLDSDDLVLPRKFEQQVAGLRKHPSCGASYGKTRCYAVGEEPAYVASKWTGERIATMFPSFLQSRWWDTSTPLYRREVTDRAGPWTDLRNEEDWEYDCRIASQGVYLHYSDDFVSDTRTHAGELLSRGGSSDPTKLRNRAEAHRLILRHARAGGVPVSAPEMQHFARELFLLARQCGAAGLTEASAELFALARDASTKEKAKGIDFRIYELVARMFGWSTVGRAACLLDGLRH